MQMITKTGELEALVERLGQADYVAVDTEFMRDATYWPKLCLVQVAGPEDEAIIDPLAPEIDLGPLLELLADTGVEKVFHAARQDIEIFYHMAQVIPEPLFDTQVAAMVCGFGDSISYENLVRTLARARVDKTSRFTDWSRRPLSERQLAYALSDVTHLRPVYEALRQRIEENGRWSWVAEEIAALQDPETYELRPVDAWQRFRSRNTNPRFLAVLKEVAAWREQQAQQRNQPRGRILKDDALMEVATNAPASGEDMERLRGVPRGFSRSRAGQELLGVIARARNLPKDQLPEAPRRPEPRQSNNTATVDLLKVLLKMKSETNQVAQRLIASAADLERIANEDEPDVPALHGWRRDMFGADALALKKGRLALAIQDGRTVLVPHDTAKDAEVAT